MNEHRHIPDLERLSVVIALILLAYSTTAFIAFPTKTLNLQLPGIFLVLRLDFITLIATAGAILAAAGANWILGTHPNIDPKTRWHHWLVPAFTSVAIGITLGTLPVGPAWWIVFALGAILMAGVLTAEYISADPADLRYSFAVLGLNAVSFGLFLIIVIAISGAGLRLYILLAAVIPTVFLISIRSLYLRLGGNWKPAWAASITLIMAQLTATMFYLPLRPLQFSMILLGVLYGLITSSYNIEEKLPGRTLWIEPVFMTTCFIVLGFLL